MRAQMRILSRKSTTLPITFVPRYRIHASWASSKSAAGKCGWVNVGLVTSLYEIRLVECVW